MSDEDRPPYNAERQGNADRQFNADQLFSLKEWMVTISSKLDRMEALLGTKADVSHVRQVEVQVGEVDRRLITMESDMRFFVPQHAGLLQDVGILKTAAASTSSVDSYKKWMFTASIGSLGALCLGVASLLLR